MSEQQRHRRSDAVAGCGGQPSFYCSRATEDTLSTCFDPVVSSAPCSQARGPVDVEDLANFCNFSSQAPQQPQAQSLNVAPQYSCCEYLPQQQAPVQVPMLQPINQPAPVPVPMQPAINQQAPVQVPMPVINQQPYYHPMTLEQAAFGYCTDSRWMACPATDYCPLYDVTQQPLESWQSLPCARDFCEYYMADDEVLEEYLNNEKRKEKSRDAARCRRSRETDIFTELAAALPVPPADAAHLDKASVMRLAIAYLKTRTLMDAVPKPLAKPEISPDMDELFLKGLDGFVLVLDNNGDMAYLSPNVKDYLGIAQMDLMGQSVFDYSHPCDHDEIRDSFSLKASEITEEHSCNFFLRLKCTLTSKGRKVNLKSASYKVIHCTGRLFAHPMTSFGSTNNNSGSDSEGQEENIVKEPGVSLVVVASPVPHPSNIEIPLGKYTFLSKHNLNMKFTYADDKLAEFLGWGSNELVGQSLFDFHHALDNLSLDKSFKSLFSKGQCETMAYRFLNKSGGYAWVVTQATLIHCSRLQKPLSVVCVNYLLSGIECADEVYSLRQLEARTSQLKQDKAAEEEQTRPVEAARPPPLAPRKPLAEKPVAVTASLSRFHEPQPKPEAADDDSESPLPAAPAARPRCLGKENEELRQPKLPAAAAPATLGFFNNQEAKPSIPVCEVAPKQQPQPSDKYPTASIFSHRTNDMNKDFLKFTKDQPDIIMLRDESENLSYLAPTFGEECVTLENAPLSEMFSESIFSSDYSLLSPKLPVGPASNDAVVCNASLGATSFNPLKDVEQTVLEVDPLKTDDCSSSDGDPFIYRDSPSRCSLGTDLHSPTLTKSPEGSGIGDSLSSLNGSGGGLSEDEMLMLSIGDLMADDDMSPLKVSYIPMSDQDEALQLLISDDMVMWGANQSNEKKNIWLTDAGEENANSSLAQLLTNETSSNKLMKEHGGALVNPTHVLGQISLKHATKDITAERERTIKRAHAPSPRSTHEIKRIKHDPESSASNSCTSASNFSSLENILSASVQNSQLLQQLVSQQAPKSRTSWPEQLSSDLRNNNRNLAEDRCRGTDEGGGGLDAMLRNSIFEGEDVGSKSATQQQRPQQQSNSVLMNLLVSGCDMQGLQNQIPMNDLSMRGLMLQQNKLSPLNVEEQLQTVPQSCYNPTLCSSDQPLSSELPYGSAIKTGPKPQYQQPQQQFYQPISFDDLDLTMSVIQDDQDELLRALDPNLV